MRTKLVYISGGGAFAPSEIKAALDEIRQNLGLEDDIVLFGLPVDELAVVNDSEAVPDHKVLQFPSAKKRSILNVIKTGPGEAETSDAPLISDSPLVVDDTDSIDADGRSITDLMGEMPGMSEDELPKKPDLADEFREFLDKEDVAAPAAPAKKPKPFGRKSKNPLNLLGDLFSYAGMAANDDAQDFVLPDFIKRP
jgi:hypothetical protein